MMNSTFNGITKTYMAITDSDLHAEGALCSISSAIPLVFLATVPSRIQTLVSIYVYNASVRHSGQSNE